VGRAAGACRRYKVTEGEYASWGCGMDARRGGATSVPSHLQRGPVLCGVGVGVGPQRPKKDRTPYNTESETQASSENQAKPKRV
jgi:hypothetical protein